MSDLEDDWEDPISDIVDTVHALGVPEYGMGGWTVPRAGWIADLTLERLRFRVSEKSARVSAYQRFAQENWLLVVADGTKSSQAFQVLDGFPTTEIVSGFSRTLFYQHPSREVLELHTGSPQ